MVNLLFAVEPSIPSGALAVVPSIWVISTAATVRAGPVGTCHGTQLTVVAIETVRASASICVLQILWGKNRTDLTSGSFWNTGDVTVLTTQTPTRTNQ